MPRFYFHLSAPDQCFRDTIGSDVSDLSAAHLRAVQLADRVMMMGGLAHSEPELRRWTVRIADDCQRPVLTVIFSHVWEKRSAAPQLNGVRTLLQRLEMARGKMNAPDHDHSATFTSLKLPTIEQRMRNALRRREHENRI
jgi:hypothetical protein